MQPKAHPSSPAPTERKPSLRESQGVLLLLAIFIIFNLLTASRYPFPWIDEVMYTDPAINLATGNGFTSSAWYAQTADQFWAGNVPLHSFLLTGWIHLFGFSMTSVRSINLFYIAAACWLIWRFCIRTGLVPSPLLRVCWILLVLCSYSVIFSYRSGRPDCLGMLIVCAICYAASLSGRGALVLLFALGALVPWTGLQLFPLISVAGILCVFFVGRSILAGVLSTWFGAGAGLSALVWFYHHQGVWHGFVRSVRQHTSIRLLDMLLGEEFRHSNVIPKDFSFLPLFLAAVLLILVLWRQGTLKLRSPLSFGLAFTVMLSLALLFGGKFPTYYGWMVYLPLSLCVCATLATLPVRGLGVLTSWGLLAIAPVLGISLHAVTALSNWTDRDPQKVQAFVDRALRAEDVAYTEFAAYYAARARCGKVFTYYYLDRIQDAEKQSISVLCVRPDHFQELTNKIGGIWVPTGESMVPSRKGLFGDSWKPMGFLSMEDYHFAVYRRPLQDPGLDTLRTGGPPVP